MELDIYNILESVRESVALAVSEPPACFVSYSLFDPIHKYLEPVTRGKSREELKADSFLGRWIQLAHDPIHTTDFSKKHPGIPQLFALDRLNWCCGGEELASGLLASGLPPNKELRAYMEKHLVRLRHPRHLAHPSEMEF